MTITLGILCKNGVVIASDGMASYGTVGVGVDNLKTHIIQDKILVAYAGADDLMQFFLNYLKIEGINLISFDSNPDQIMSNICSQYSNYLYNLFNNYPEPYRQNNINHINGLISSGQFDALLGFDINNTHYLYHISNNMRYVPVGQTGMWYTVRGRGHHTGMPSIHLIKRILNIKDMPCIDEAVNLAYWTISHAIDVTCGGIGKDITIASLKKQNDSYSASYIKLDGEGGTKEYIEDMYNHIHGFKKSLAEVKQDNIIESVPVFTP